MMQAEPLEQQSQARNLIDEGVREARAIGHPIARGRHLGAWAFRLSAVDPEAAAGLLSDLPDDRAQRAQLLLTIVSDRLDRGDTQLEPHFSQTVAEARGAEADTRLRVLNSLSELAAELGERNREAALTLLRSLIPEARSLVVEGAEFQQFQTLACALVGEALLVLGDDLGLELLHEAEELARALPGKDAVLAFLAPALAEREPERAAGLSGEIDDPAARLDARIQLAGRVADSVLRRRIFAEAEPDALFVEHMRGPEALVRLGQAMRPTDPEGARALFEKALAGASETNPQLRALQQAGVAVALADTDREWAGRIFHNASDAAMEEEERVRRVGTLAVIANEMAASHPREAADLFQRAVEEAADLDALWQYAHVLDVVFRPDRSPYLDVAPARALVDGIVARLSDDDPRIPGVFGLPEAARMMQQVDPERSVGLIRRWMDAARASEDSEGMTQASVALYQSDPEAGLAGLREVRDYLLQRIDCPSMGEYSRSVAPIAPDLVLGLAERIPDRRERRDARIAAAVQLYEDDPDRSLELLRGLEHPADRSLALLLLVDRLLGTEDRPRPQPLLEELP